MLLLKYKGICDYVYNFLGAPAKRKTRGERVIENAIKHFKEMQDAAEKRFMEWEEKRWRSEMETEERRRREDREHERMLMQMMLQCGAPQPPVYPSYPQTYPYSLPSTSDTFTCTDEEQQL